MLIIPKNSPDKVDKKIEFVNPKVAADKTPDNAETPTNETSTPPVDKTNPAPIANSKYGVPKIINQFNDSDVRCPKFP
jgi:hypothetical protein